MPGAKFDVADYLSRHPVGESSCVSVYDNTFTVAKRRLISNSLGNASLENTAGVVEAKRRKSSVSANKSAMCKKSAILRLCISMYNDQKSAKVVTSITECQLRELEILSNSISNICEFPIASINLKK